MDCTLDPYHLVALLFMYHTSSLILVAIGVELGYIVLTCIVTPTLHYECTTTKKEIANNHESITIHYS